MYDRLAILRISLVDDPRRGWGCLCRGIDHTHEYIDLEVEVLFASKFGYRTDLQLLPGVDSFLREAREWPDFSFTLGLNVRGNRWFVILCDFDNKLITDDKVPRVKNDACVSLCRGEKSCPASYHRDQRHKGRKRFP